MYMLFMMVSFPILNVIGLHEVLVFDPTNENKSHKKHDYTSGFV